MIMYEFGAAVSMKCLLACVIDVCLTFQGRMSVLLFSYYTVSDYSYISKYGYMRFTLRQRSYIHTHNYNNNNNRYRHANG